MQKVLRSLRVVLRCLEVIQSTAKLESWDSPMKGHKRYPYPRTTGPVTSSTSAHPKSSKASKPGAPTRFHQRIGPWKLVIRVVFSAKCHMTSSLTTTGVESSIKEKPYHHPIPQHLGSPWWSKASGTPLHIGSFSCPTVGRCQPPWHCVRVDPLPMLGMVIPPLIGNPYNWYVKPYYGFDD